MKTLVERIEETEAAISAIKSGAQEYRIGNRMVRRADLAQLETTIKELYKEYNEQQGYSTFITGFVGR